MAISRRAWFAWIAVALVARVAAPAWAAPLPAVESLVEDVSQVQYQAYHLAVENMGLGLYGGPDYSMGYRNRDGWRGSGSLGNQEARLYLVNQFAAMGLDVTVQGEYLNVVAELPGTTRPESIYIVGAHYDHLTGDMPGGDDNASGTAGLLEVARVLSQCQFEATIRFIGFNAEEDGLLGSSDYVSRVVKAGGSVVVEDVAGMISLDMILQPSWHNPSGDTKDGGRIDLDLAVRPIEACRQWAQLFVQAGADYVPGLVIEPYETSWSGSDHVPFANAGLPALLAIENTASEVWSGHANAYYHTYRDASDRAAGAYYDYGFATDVTRVVVALLAQEAVLVPEPSVLLLMLVAVPWVVAARRRIG